MLFIPGQGHHFSFPFLCLNLSAVHVTALMLNALAAGAPATKPLVPHAIRDAMADVETLIPPIIQYLLNKRLVSLLPPLILNSK